MYQLLLADGGTVSVSMAGVGQQGDLWVHVHGLTLPECVAVFSSPEKTRSMHIDYDGESVQDTFEGYTELFSVSTAGDFLRVGLARGANDA